MQVTVLMAVVRLQAIRRGALGRRRARLIREEMVYEEDLEESRELKRVLITEEVLKHDEVCCATAPLCGMGWGILLPGCVQ